MTKSRWSWWEKADGTDLHRSGQLLSGIWPLHAHSQHAWVWRGQWDHQFNLDPAIHSRIPRESLDDEMVVKVTRDLINKARRASLDHHEGVRLPDMALLAMLQHHGAATPLLDVSLDPLVGVYMALEDGQGNIDEFTDGILFAIKRPKSELEVPAFTADTFEDIYHDIVKAKSCYFYLAPPVSERLRIQRGAFLIGSARSNDDRTTSPLSLPEPNTSRSWLHEYIEHVGKPGSIAIPADVGAFRIAGRLKPTLKNWLERRTGLTTKDVVLPPAWHNPHLESFCAAHNRGIEYQLRTRSKKQANKESAPAEPTREPRTRGR